MPALCSPGIHQAVRVRTHIFSHRCILLWFVLILSGAVLIFIWCLGKINLLLCWKAPVFGSTRESERKKGIVCLMGFTYEPMLFFFWWDVCMCSWGPVRSQSCFKCPSSSKMGRRKRLNWMSRQSKIYYIKWPTQNQCVCVCACFFRCRWMCEWQQMCKWYLFKHRGFVSLPLWCRLPPGANRSDVPG